MVPLEKTREIATDAADTWPKPESVEAAVDLWRSEQLLNPVRMMDTELFAAFRTIILRDMEYTVLEVLRMTASNTKLTLLSGAPQAERLSNDDLADLILRLGYARVIITTASQAGVVELHCQL